MPDPISSGAIKIPSGYTQPEGYIIAIKLLRMDVRDIHPHVHPMSQTVFRVVFELERSAQYVREVITNHLVDVPRERSLV